MFSNLNILSHSRQNGAESPSSQAVAVHQWNWNLTSFILSLTLGERNCLSFVLTGNIALCFSFSEVIFEILPNISCISNYAAIMLFKVEGDR